MPAVPMKTAGCVVRKKLQCGDPCHSGLGRIFHMLKNGGACFEKSFSCKGLGCRPGRSQPDGPPRRGATARARRGDAHGGPPRVAMALRIFCGFPSARLGETDSDGSFRPRSARSRPGPVFDRRAGARSLRGSGPVRPIGRVRAVGHRPGIDAFARRPRTSARAEGSRPVSGRFVRPAQSSPSISPRFCTAAPEAPLPRLSRRATSTA